MSADDLTEFKAVPPYVVSGAQFLRDLATAGRDTHKMLAIIDREIGGDVGAEILTHILNPTPAAVPYEVAQTGLHSTLKKINAIKAARAATGSGLKEMKDWIEGTVPTHTLTLETAALLDAELRQCGYMLIRA